MDVVNSVHNAFQFQRAAAISILLDNLDNFDNIKNEGKNDIVIRLQDGSYIYAQAKSAHDNENSDKARNDFKTALDSLRKNWSEGNCHQLIYITNIRSLLGANTFVGDFISGQTISFSNLDAVNKDLILELYGNDFKYNLLEIQFLKFIGDDTKQEWIIEKMENCFKERRRLSSVRARRVYKTWNLYLDANASCKDKSIVCDRKTMTWGMIVDQIEDISDEVLSTYDSEIFNRYDELIERLCGRFDIVSRISGDFADKLINSRNNNYSIHDYATEYWNNHLDILDILDTPINIKEIVLKILIENVLKRKDFIRNVKVEMEI